MKKGLKIFTKYYLIFCVYALIGWLYEVLWMWFVVPPKKFINRGVLLGPFLPIYGFGMIILLVLLNKLMSKKHEINKPENYLIYIVTITTFTYTSIVEYTTTSKIYSVIEFIEKYGMGLILVNIISIAVIYAISRLFSNKKIAKIDTTIILVFLAIWIITTIIEYVSHFIIDKYFHILLWDYTYDFLNINKRVNWDASRNFAIGGTFLLYTVQPLLNKYLPKIKENIQLKITIILGTLMSLDFILHVILKII